MFLHRSVILFTGWGVSQHGLGQTPPLGRHLPSSGRYASYWNAFLLQVCPSNLGKSTLCQADVPLGEDTSILKADCDGLNTCDVAVDKTKFDPLGLQTPCENVHRYLEVKYQCFSEYSQFKCPSLYEDYLETVVELK